MYCTFYPREPLSFLKKHHNCCTLTYKRIFSVQKYALHAYGNALQHSILAMQMQYETVVGWGGGGVCAGLYCRLSGHISKMVTPHQ
jgi:hypothetical protein